MRLIDADYLMCDIGCVNAVKYGNETPEQQHASYSTLMMYEIADYINDAETVDAVEVVRCRDCMHYNHAVIDDDPTETFEVDVCLHKDLFPTRVTPDFYCAHGAKMEVM